MAMNKKTRLILILFSLTLLLACGSSKIRSDLPAEKRMEIAIEMFEKRDYLDARTQFRILTLSHGGSTIADKAQYYYAECHFYLKEYILSANEYERLIKVYPNSDYVDDAKYKLGLSYFELSPKYSLDQEYTYKAIKEFQEFLEDYYDSPLVKDVEAKLQECRDKLAHKVYSAAVQYRKMGYHQAALRYFTMVLERHYDSAYAPEAQYGVAESHRRLEQHSEALEAYQSLVNKFPRHELAQKARPRIQEMEEKIAQQGEETSAVDP